MKFTFGVAQVGFQINPEMLVWLGLFVASAYALAVISVRVADIIRARKEK